MNSFWWLSFIILIKYSIGASYWVHCDFCLELSQAVPGQHCKVKVIQQEIYPAKNETPVHRPTWHTAAWYSFKKKDNFTALAFNMTWSHSGQHFLLAKAYVLSILRTASNSPYMRHFSIKLNQDIRPSDQVFINYPCFGRSRYEYITPGHSYTLKLRSLPSYHIRSDHRTNEANNEIFIPECDDGIVEIEQLEECADDRTYYVEDDDDDDYDDASSALPTQAASFPEPSEVNFIDNSFAWIIPLFVFVCAAVLLIIFCISRRRNADLKKGNKKKSTLILASVTGAEGDDILYLETIDLLGALMRQYGNGQVEYVMWKTRTDYTDWIYETAKSSDQIVLVCTPLGKRNLQKCIEKDPFYIGLQLLLTHNKQKFWNFKNLPKFYVVHFDGDEKKSVPENLVSEKIKRHKLPKKLEWLFRNVSGINFNTIPNEDALGELQNYFKLINAEEKKDINGYLKNGCVRSGTGSEGVSLLLTDKQEQEDTIKTKTVVNCV